MVAAQFCKAFTADPAMHAAIAVLEARAFAADGRLGDALVASREGRAYAPTDLKIALLEAEILAADGKFTEAEGLLRFVLESHSSHFAFGPAESALTGVRARFLLAEVLLSVGRASEAAIEARRVIAGRPAFGPVWLTLGEALLLSSDGREFDALLSRLGGMPGSRTAQLVLEQKRAVRDGQIGAAAARIEAAATEEPRDVFVQRACAEILHAAGTNSDALGSALRSALESNPLCTRSRAIQRSLSAVSGRPYSPRQTDPLLALAPLVARD